MNNYTNPFNFILLGMIALISVSTGCSTMTPEEQDAKRKALDAMAEETIARLIEQDPSVQQELDESLGYMVADKKVTKVPIVGAGSGEGVLIDKSSDKPIYITVGRFDVGGGWGVRAFKILVITKSQEILESEAPKVSIHRYQGKYSGDQIKFVMQTEGGYSEYVPVEFTANRMTEKDN